jgi:uncharacterized protein (TIGR02284 family)
MTAGQLSATNELILVCRGCESALSTAAEVAESSAARDRYQERAAAWGGLRVSLEDVIEDLGGKPLKSAGVTGTLRRAWIKIQSGLGDPAAIAAECGRCEAAALRRCAEVVQDDVPAAVRDLVARFCKPGAQARL